MNINFIWDKKVNRETFWALSAKSISAISGIILLITIPLTWGIENYGYFSLILAYITICSLLFGNSINSALKKEFTEFTFSEFSKKYFIAGIKLKTSIFILCSLIFYVFIFFSSLTLLKENFFQFLVLLFLMNYGGLINNIFEATHNLYYVAISYTFEYLIKLTLVASFVIFDIRSLTALLNIFIIGYALSIIYGLVVLQSKLQIDLKHFLTPVDFHIYIALFKRILLLSLSSASFVLLTRIDTILLSHFSSIENVGYYNIASELTRNGSIIGVALVLGSVPLFVNGNRRILFKNLIYKIFFINLLIFFGIIFFADFLIQILYGSGYEKVSTLIKVLALYPLLLTLQNLILEISLLKDKTHLIFVSGMFAVGINIFLSLILIPIWGTYGAAISTLISYLVWFTLNYLGVRKYI